MNHLPTFNRGNLVESVLLLQESTQKAITQLIIDKTEKNASKKITQQTKRNSACLQKLNDSIWKIKSVNCFIIV
jgi:hypothetical protein